MNLSRALNPIWLARDYLRMRKRLQTLENRVRELELASDPHSLWLFRNRVERMDATRRDLFDPKRADFHLERYRFAARYAAGCHVVDAACGTGYGSRVLKTDGAAAEVFGIDVDSEAIEYARAKHAPDGVQFKVADATNTGLPSGWADLVVSFETIEHVPDDIPLIAEFARLLKPQKTLIISTPNNWPLEIAPYHRRVYDYESFRAVLCRHFEVSEMFNQNSGSESPFNHGEQAGLKPTTPENRSRAECYLAVCARK